MAISPSSEHDAAPSAAASAANHPSSDDVVLLRGVGKTYGSGQAAVVALDAIDFRVARGSFWSIVGQSGSGKSTMLNILGCLDRPTVGEYWLDGQNVAELDDDPLSDVRLRKLGFIFQSFHLISDLSVRENIELPLFYQAVDPAEAKARAAAMAEKVGLGNRLHHRPQELSGGQRQRVAIARALATDPAVLLADEPTGNLDTATSESILALLQELNDAGKTIIMVTHEPDIANHADHQMVLRDGRIERMG